MPTSSASVELFVFSFCLHELLYITPLPNIIIITLRLRIYELPTHQFG